MSSCFYRMRAQADIEAQGEEPDKETPEMNLTVAICALVAATGLTCESCACCVLLAVADWVICRRYRRGAHGLTRGDRSIWERKHRMAGFDLACNVGRPLCLFALAHSHSRQRR